MSPDPVARLNAALSGRYRLEHQLGAGGMATVYLADDLKHERKVALKVLKPELAAFVGAERFLAEIKTTANLQHPHILPLFDSGEADGFLFYVMPYVEGESLRERLDRERQLPVDEAVRIATEVADALEAAHEQGIVHRDVKPANILLSRGRPLVTDFGIALAVDAAGGERLTETGLSLGTPHYMSPEQATGDGPVGPATDTYALGCVLHEMLVGEPPYTGSTAQAVLGKIITAEPQSVASRRKTVPPHVDGAVRRALEKLPPDRFPTTGSFADALADASFRYGEVAGAGPAAAASSERPNSRRVAVAGSGVVVLAMLAVAWVLTRDDAPSAPASVDRSVAVLPFEYIGTDSERYFADAFADQLINALIRIPDLKVTNRASSFAFRESGRDPRVIADSLGVAHLVTGTFQQAGNRTVIGAQLVEAESGFILWSDRFTPAFADVIELQEQVARSIAEGLRVELAGVEGERLTGAVAASPEAQDHYYRGRQLFYQRTPEGMRGAVEAFSRAIEADPEFAPAYAGLAMALYPLGVGFSANPPGLDYAWAARGVAAANRAIELDSLNGEGYAARGNALMVPSGKVLVERLERDFLRAIELQPSSADAHGWYGLLLSTAGRHEESIERHETALTFDGVSTGRRMGYVYSALAAGRPALGLEQVRRAREIQPGLAGVATVYEVLSLLLLDRAPECLELDLSTAPSYEAMCLHAVGRTAEAETLVDSLSAQWGSSSSYLLADGLSMYRAWTGDVDGALLWVERGLAVSPHLVTAFMWPPGIWEPVLAEDEERVRTTLQRLSSEAAQRVLRESQEVVLP